MLDLKTLRVDPELANAGVWVPYSGAEFLLARFNNREAEAARALLSLEFYTELTKREGETTPQDQKNFQTLQNTVLSEHVLKDWRNLGEDGVEIPYSPAAALAILEDEGYDELRSFLINESLKRERYVAKEVAAVVKDVKPSANS